jgi:hypothetical protein
VNRRLLRSIQHRTARVAVGASAARGQGAPGVVRRARSFMASFRLRQITGADAATFSRRLDRATMRLQEALPRRASSWGLARKLLNIFIRDCLYVGYLERAHGLRQIEAFCEVPLDSITARAIRRSVPALPRWPGVKHLDPELSARYQEAAHTIAGRMGIARVHLDALWWGARR